MLLRTTNIRTSVFEKASSKWNCFDTRKLLILFLQKHLTELAIEKKT